MALYRSIRYYKGGYYTNPFYTGTIDQKREYAAIFYSTTLGTLRACVKRGWMEYVSDEDVYKRRWKITNEGINVVNESEGLK